MTRTERARAIVLESVLTGQELPGVDRSVTFPDLQHGEELLLIDDGDGAELNVPVQVTLVTREELDQMELDARTQILEFLPPEDFPGTIGVRLRLSAVLPDHGQVPLGEIVATFDDTDPLLAVEPTHVLAY